ncbi:MAG TPA: hypothetical protein VMG36_08295, partial [Thermoplasmata archaeon]|nr:hypothetical protein [Thermoplasmata archaeon]
TGSSTTGIIYVPDDGGELFVAEPSAMVVAVLSVAPEQVVSTIYLGSEPGAMVYDPETDQVFVTTFGNLTVIAAGSRTVVGTIPLPWPATNLTYDSVGHAILAASVDGTALYIVSDATDSVTKTIGIGGGVTGVAFDPASDVAFVAYESVPASAAVEAISLTTDTVLSDVAVGPSPSTPGPILYDPGSNLVFEAAHPLYFGPQLVEISASTGRVLGSTATPSNLTSLAVDPTTAEVVGTGFSAFGGILAVVPTMVGAVVQNVSAGEDPLDVAFDPGTGQLFVTQGWVGEIVCLRYPAGAYSLDIATAGLPIGKAWTIVLGGTVENESAAAVAFSVVNGTLPYIFVGPSGYRIHGIPPSGALDVAGASVGLAFSFARGSTATVVFKGVDFGGLYWCAYLLWETCTNTTSIAFDNLTPASYAYSIGQLIGFRETVHLSGRAVGLGGTVHATTTSTFTVRFSLLLAVRFTEIGLPIGTSWGVRVAGQIYATTALGFFVNLTNGSYGIKVLAPAGFTGHALPSVLRVNNDTPIVWIEFARVPAR